MTDMKNLDLSCGAKQNREDAKVSEEEVQNESWPHHTNDVNENEIKEA